MNLKVPVLPTSNETPWPPFLPLDACKNKDIKVKATFVADEVVFGKQVILESCVIGKGCILGNNVTIRNSILWDGVVIEKGQDDGIKAKSPHVD
jgi:NDP-sugar pyrophosphorylase family protein